MHHAVVKLTASILNSASPGKAVALLMCNALWNPKDIKRHLKDPRYEYVGEIKAAYQRRRKRLLHGGNNVLLASGKRS